MIFLGRQQKAVMLCYVRWSKVKLLVNWSQTDKIDEIQGANGQRHVAPLQATSGSQKF